MTEIALRRKRKSNASARDVQLRKKIHWNATRQQCRG